MTRTTPTDSTGDSRVDSALAIAEKAAKDCGRVIQRDEVNAIVSYFSACLTNQVVKEDLVRSSSTTLVGSVTTTTTTTTRNPVGPYAPVAKVTPSRRVIAGAASSGAPSSQEVRIHTPPRDLRDIAAGFVSDTSGSSPDSETSRWREVYYDPFEWSRWKEKVEAAIHPGLKKVNSRGQYNKTGFYILLRVSETSGLSCGAYVCTWAQLLEGIHGPTDWPKSHAGEGCNVQRCGSWDEALKKWDAQGHDTNLRLWVAKDLVQ